MAATGDRRRWVARSKDCDICRRDAGLECLEFSNLPELLILCCKYRIVIMSSETIPLNVVLTAAVPIAAFIGFFSHLTYFIRGEHHTYVVRYLQALYFLPAFSVVALVRLGKFDMKDAVVIMTVVTSTYVVSLFASIILYRILFHPLRRFPGPFFAKISKFWHSSQITDFYNYKLYDRMSKKYGKFVRLGESHAASLIML
jgi:hypothetical protein